MDMVKYIVKRLLLSILILFGVSIIIYALARMMPTDYVDQQYSSAVSQGTMRQEDVDRIKDLYGLSMPDAYLSVKTGNGSSYSGTTFTKNAKSEKRDVDLELYLKEQARVAGQLSRTDLTDEERADFERQKAENDAALEAFYNSHRTADPLFCREDGSYKPFADVRAKVAYLYEQEEYRVYLQTLLGQQRVEIQRDAIRRLAESMEEQEESL